MDRQRVKLVVALLLLAVAGFLIVRTILAPPEHGEDLPQGTFWICKNPQCQAEFNMSLAEVLKLRGPNGAVPCPQCQDRRTVRGHLCPSCQRTYPPVGHSGKPDKCPRCGEPIPESGDVLRARNPGA